MPAVLWVRRALTLARDHKGMASPSDGRRKSHHPSVETRAQLASASIAPQRRDECAEGVWRRTCPHHPGPCDSVHHGDLCRDRSAAGHGGHRQDRLKVGFRGNKGGHLCKFNNSWPWWTRPKAAACSKQATKKPWRRLLDPGNTFSEIVWAIANAPNSTFG